MYKKRILAAVIAVAALCSVFIHAAAADVIQKGGLVYVPSHSVYFVDVDENFSWAV